MAAVRFGGDLAQFRLPCEIASFRGITGKPTAMVAEARKRAAAGREFDLPLPRARIDIVPMDAVMVEEARRVWREYGKGNHPAGLNFCDCCALALARVSGPPLLFKGEDFVRAKAVSALKQAGA